MGCWGLEQGVRGDNKSDIRSRVEIQDLARGKAHGRLTAPTHLYPSGCASLEPEKGTCPAYWP